MKKILNIAPLFDYFSMSLLIYGYKTRHTEGINIYIYTSDKKVHLTDTNCPDCVQ